MDLITFAKQVLPISLWLIMLSMGLSLTIGDFSRILTQRRPLVVGTLSMLLVPPVVGLLIALVFASNNPILAVGFVLLATCPGGMVSNMMTDLAKGDLALSVSLTIVVSFVYVLVIPFYAYLALHYFLGMNDMIQVPLAEFIWKIFRLTIVPVTIGLVIRHYLPTLSAKVRAPLKPFAMAVLLIAFFIILWNQIEVLKQNFWLLFGMTLGMNAVVIALAFGLTRSLRLNTRQTAAVVCEHLIRQEMTALYIAVSIVGSFEMSLPMIMNTPVALALCFIVVLFMRRIITREDVAAKAAV